MPPLARPACPRRFAGPVGDPRQIIPAWRCRLGVGAVHANHDDDPGALARDAEVAAALPCPLHSCKDHVVLERAEVLTAAGRHRLHALQERAWLQRLRLNMARARGAARTPGARLAGRAAQPVRRSALRASDLARPGCGPRQAGA